MKKGKDFQNTVLFGKKGTEGKRFSKFWVRVALLFLFGVILAGALYFIMRSSWFDVGSVSVEGAELVPQEMVVSTIETDIIGKSALAAFLGPKNILFWFFADPNPRLLRFPQVRSVDVEISFWKKTIVIRIDERRIQSVLCKSASGNCYGLDQDGIIFTKSPEVRGALILKFEDESTSSVVLGNPYLRDPQWLKNITATFDIMKQDGFVPQSVRVDNTSLEEWRAIFPSELAFYFSLHFVPENLGSILKDIGNRTDIKNLQYFDFRVPNRIYYK